MAYQFIRSAGNSEARARVSVPSFSEALDALRDSFANDPSPVGLPAGGAGSEIASLFPIGVAGPPSFDAGGAGLLIDASDPLADEQLPVCSIPPPVSEQPVIETEGFLPAPSGDEPQGPACSMPVPLSHQQHPLDLIVSLPLTEAGGYGGDWLSALIGGPETVAANAPDYGAGGKAEATFALWYDLLGTGNSAGDALIAAKAGDEATMRILATGDALGMPKAGESS